MRATATGASSLPQSGGKPPHSKWLFGHHYKELMETLDPTSTPAQADNSAHAPVAARTGDGGGAAGGEAPRRQERRSTVVHDAAAHGQGGASRDAAATRGLTAPGVAAVSHSARRRAAGARGDSHRVCDERA